MMNNFKSQNTKHYSIFKQNNKKSTRLTQNQVRLLEASFNASNRLDPNRKLQLAQELHIPPRQVATWYQNRRARWKNQSLEVDYSALHVRLETVLAQKGQLEEEVQRLRVELQKSQAEIAYLQKTQIQPTVSFPSTFINDDQMNCLFMNDHDQGLGVEEVYDYLIGTNGSNFN